MTVTLSALVSHVCRLPSIRCHRSVARGALCARGTLSRVAVLAGFVEVVRSGALVRVRTSATVAIQELARLTQQLISLRQNASRLTAFQETFSVTELGFLNKVCRRRAAVGHSGLALATLALAYSCSTLGMVEN